MTGIMPAYTVTVTRVAGRFRGGVAATEVGGLGTSVPAFRPIA